MAGSLLKLLLGLLVSISLHLRSAVAVSPPTFCKCTCFKNSTLIQLGPQQSDIPFPTTDPDGASSSPSSSPSSATETETEISTLTSSLSSDSTTTTSSSTAALDRDVHQKNLRHESRAASSSCTQCTRAFCLSHNLPICKDADSDTDVVATCFQRDSRKDQFIVWGFILGTTGLLGWAAARRLQEFRSSKSSFAGLGSVSGSGPDRGDYMQVPLQREGDNAAR